jgi:hypothetical protein
MLTSEPLLGMAEDRRRHQQLQQCLNIAEAEERQMIEWQRLYPEDIETKQAFWRLKKAERRDAKVEKSRKKGWNEVLLAGSRRQGLRVAQQPPRRRGQ